MKNGKENRFWRTIRMGVFGITLSLMVTLAAAQSANQQEAVMEMGNAVINALKNNDSLAYAQLHLSDKDVAELSQKLAPSPNNQRNTRAVAAQAVANVQERGKRRFGQIVRQGIDDQINWKEVEFSHVENSDAPQREGQLPVIANPVVVFLYNDEAHRIPIGKIAQLNRGWIIVEPATQ